MWKSCAKPQPGELPDAMADFWVESVTALFRRRVYHQVAPAVQLPVRVTASTGVSFAVLNFL